MFAVLPVLVVHFSVHLTEKLPPLVWVGGTFGVEIFFALSGFLIGGIILRDFQHGFSAKVAWVFYVRRWLRTLPLYYVFFLASAFVTIDGLTLDHAWTSRCWFYLVFLQNLAWPMVASWYHETWSLAVEEWFYLLFPALFAVLPGISPRMRVLLIAVILAVTPLLLRIHEFNPELNYDEYLRKIVILRLDAIAYGILAIWAVTVFPVAMRYWSNVIGLAGFVGLWFSAAILLGIIDVGQFCFRTFALSLSAASFAAIVLWARFQSWTWIEQGGEADVVRWVSTRSYALYLCHGSIIKTLIAHRMFGQQPWIPTLIFVLGCIVLAEVAHRLVERPFMHIRPREIHN